MKVRINEYQAVYGIMLLVIGLVSCDLSYAEEKTLKWETPTTRVDGTALNADEIKAYRIFMDDKPLLTKPSPWHKLDVPEGKHCFKVQVEDTGGLLSDFSNIVCVTIAKVITPPKPVELKF